jgi:hypothetical protein
MIRDFSVSLVLARSIPQRPKAALRALSPPTWGLVREVLASVCRVLMTIIRNDRVFSIDATQTHTGRGIQARLKNFDFLGNYWLNSKVWSTRV